jgi:DNA-directed RNA polymerase specialized sigma24 family protein
MTKGGQVVNPRKLRQKLTELRLAGRTDQEIAETLGVTPATVQYVASLYLMDEGRSRHRPDGGAARLAYELRHAGKSFSEISQLLNISRPRAHQIVHKYEWELRRRRQRALLGH